MHRPDLERHCEALVVQVGTTAPALLAVCYRPPNVDRAVAQVADLLRGLHRTGCPFLLVGDFNMPEISWSTEEAVISRRSNRAVIFVDAVTECEANQSVTSATRGENVLDLAISRGGVAVSEVRDQLFPSDHLAVDTRFAVTVGNTHRATRSRVYDYKRADFVGLRRALRLLPWHMLEGMEVDAAVELFYDLVFAAVNDYVPMIEMRHRYPPWFDRHVRNLLRKKELAHRRKRDPSAENITAHAQR